MNKKGPNLIKMLRAPFFSSVYAPILVGTAAAVLISGEFNLYAFVLALFMGTGLHAATNVYNDIYDTLQGTDKININRNEFSGGSGVLVDNPQLFSKMFFLARTSLIIAFLAAVGLFFIIDKSLYPHLIGLFLLSAFFSKYYTASPFKLSYRGFGEISVWLAFGPMGVLFAAVSQNIGLHNSILLVMPATGLSTLSILWIGQMIDLPADQATGKLGMVARFGIEKAKLIFPFIHIIIITNIILLPILSETYNFISYFPLIPYLILLPKILSYIYKKEESIDNIKIAAKLNVQLHMLFSITYVTGIFLQIIM